MFADALAPTPLLPADVVNEMFSNPPIPEIRRLNRFRSILADLGELWHSETRQPLPLGGILARRHLGEDVLGKVQQVVHDSILYGLNHPDEALETMRQHAAEMDDEVLMAHVDLYVNDETLFLGKAGREALAAWSEKAIQLNSPSSAEFNRLEVFGDEA